MEGFFDQMTNQSWWVSVGLASLFLSVIAVYIVRLIDKSFVKSVEILKNINERSQERIQEVENLEKQKALEISEDLHEQSIISMIVLRGEIRTIIWILAAIVLILVQDLNTFHVEITDKVIGLSLIVCFFGMIYQYASSRKWTKILGEGFKLYKEKTNNTGT